MKQQLEELEQQRKGAELRGWAAMLKDVEELMNKLAKTKAPQLAATAAKDMKVVAADQHNFQNRHEARKRQLEENQK